MKYFTSIALLVMAAGVQARSDSLLANLGSDSPWIINHPNPHVQGEHNHAKFKGTPFTMSRDARNGTTEYRAFHNNVIGMETVIKRFGETSLYFRQVTDGKKLLQLVYAGRQGLVECDVQRNLLKVDGFVAAYLKSNAGHVGHLRHVRQPIDVGAILGNTELFGRTAAFRMVEHDVISEPYASILDVKTLLDDCHRVHHLRKHALRASGVNLENYKQVKTPEDREVSQEFHPRRVKRTKRGTKKSRSKRGIIVPDTKWCGAGAVTEDFQNVGHSRSTDRCCRDHDHCPYYVESFSRGYNMFNARFYTISHCLCDETFRTCLKTANTEQSSMVGRIYFNLLGLSCFEFELEEVCAERSWFGICQKTEMQSVAKVRGSLEWS